MGKIVEVEGNLTNNYRCLTIKIKLKEFKILVVYI